MKLFYITAILSFGIFTGCAAISVDYSYNTSFDFSSLSRYSWLELPIDFPTDNFSAQNIRTAIDRQMEKKGFTLTTGAPDFILSLQGQKETVRRSPKSTAVSGELSASEQFQHGMFTLTIIDAKTDRLIWEGYAKGVLPPNLSTKGKVEKTNEVIANLLDDFPPDN
jgi:hypothetical protein